MVKVAVVGAAGGIGQPLSLLMKLNPLVDELNLFDVVNAPGVSQVSGLSSSLDPPSAPLFLLLLLFVFFVSSSVALLLV